VNGGSVGVPITWAKVTYSVTFTESGLPTGTNWSVTLAGSSENSTGFTIIFTEPNGTYSYTIGVVPGWAASRYSGSVTVNGAPMGVAITWTEVTYSVTFTETGLPNGKNWSVTLAGSSENSTGSTIQFTEPNGTFSYTIGAVPGWATSLYSGTVTVYGKGMDVSIAWTEVTYSVGFSESGLPSGLTWQVTVNGVAKQLTTDGATDTLIFAEANGTFAYTITDISGWHQSTLPYTGTVVVSGSAVAEPTLVYLKETYSVAFSESGLPLGLTWQVTVNGVAEHLTTDGATDRLVFTEPNGTYTYTITDNSGWHQSTLGYTGNVVTSGGVVTEPTLAYVQVTYPAAFTESGLPSGANWSVTLIGGSSAVVLVSTLGGGSTALTRWSAGASTIWFNVSNATYTYSSTATGRASVTGNLTVSGPLGAPVMVDFPPAPSPSGLSTLDYLTIGGAVGVLAIGVLLALLLLRRRKSPLRAATPTSQPAESGPPTPP
jgi:hypothetical protein